jgi:hypothetical protein
VTLAALDTPTGLLARPIPCRFEHLHPSGAALLWPEGGPLDVDYTAVPVVTEQQVVGFLAGVAPLIGASSYAPKGMKKPATGQTPRAHSQICSRLT